MSTDRTLGLNFRSQELGLDAGRHTCWHVITTCVELRATELAILICDMWDMHWSKGATERVDALAPRMDQVIRAARVRGVQVIHAPSETMGFYAQTPARQRVIDAPHVEPPAPQLERLDPLLPIDDSGGGSDTGEDRQYKAWSRQHPAIAIDPKRDGISDDGQEVYNFLRQKGIEHLLIMGVHTNMCVLNRSFGIKQMTRWGVHVALVRDLTDAMYNPAMPPYVSHEEGTRLVVAYIEKFWCPTIESRELLSKSRVVTLQA